MYKRQGQDASADEFVAISGNADEEESKTSETKVNPATAGTLFFDASGASSCVCLRVFYFEVYRAMSGTARPLTLISDHHGMARARRLSSKFAYNFHHECFCL